MPSKLLVATDSGTIKFVNYEDGGLRYKSVLTVKGLTKVDMLGDQLLIVETHSDLNIYRTSDMQ